MDVVQSVEQHLHDLLNLCQGELDVSVTQQASQVVLTEVKHQVDAAFVSVELSRCGMREKQINENMLQSLITLFLSITHRQRWMVIAVIVWRHVAPTFSSADLYQVHHVLMFEQLQDLDLSQSCDGELKHSRHTQTSVRDELIKIQQLYSVRVMTCYAYYTSIHLRRHYYAYKPGSEGCTYRTL